MSKRWVTDCDKCGEEIEGDVLIIRTLRKVRGSNKRAKTVAKYEVCEACADTMSEAISKED